MKTFCAKIFVIVVGKSSDKLSNIFGVTYIVFFFCNKALLVIGRNKYFVFENWPNAIAYKAKMN